MTSKNIIKELLYVLLISIAVPFLLGFLNDFHPLFDSFSHFRVHQLLILLPTLFVLAFFHKSKNMLIFLFLFLIGSFYLYKINQPFIPQEISKEKTNSLKHIQFNLRFDNPSMDKTLNYLKASEADVITLEEVSQNNQERLQELYTDYPYQAYCAFYPVVGGVAILSKHPFNKENSICMEGKGLLWQQIVVNEKPINIVAIHTLWPYPYEQAQQIQEMKRVFKNMQGLTLIAGDFNAASWSHSVKEIEKASNTKVINGMRWTIDLKNQFPLIPNFKLAIDHLLISKEFQVQEIFIEKDLGSDHLPVVSVIRY